MLYFNKYFSMLTLGHIQISNISSGFGTSDHRSLTIHVWLRIYDQIKFQPEWIPREDNQLADYWSKEIGHDD